MTTTSATPTSSARPPEPPDVVIRRIDDRFVSIQTGSIFKVVFSPIRPGIKLFDTPPVVIGSGKPITPPGARKPVITPPAANNKPVTVTPPGTNKPISATPPAKDQPAQPQLPPVQKDKVNDKDVLIYGNPKGYDNLNYAQGYSIAGYRGTCGEASIANLLTIAGQNVTEKDVTQRAIANGWCDTTPTNPSFRGGTTSDQWRKLLDSYGVATGVINEFDPAKLAALIKEGKGILIAVNNVELWGGSMPPEMLRIFGANHVINLTGAVYAADTGALQGFYIADSGRGHPDDKARYLTVAELDHVAHFEFGCNAIYTVDPIKKAPPPASDPTGPADPSKPQWGKEIGVKIIIYGDPQSYHNLNYVQSTPLIKGYEENSGEIAVANITALAGRPVSAKEVMETAIKEKLCDTTSKDSALRGSTTASDQLALLNKFGIAATLDKGFDENAIAQHIIEGKGVILSVNSGMLWRMTLPKNEGHTDYAVTITGVAYAADSGEVAGFYLSDPVWGIQGGSRPRYVEISVLRQAVDAVDVTTITTKDAIKPNSPPPGLFSGDPTRSPGTACGTLVGSGKGSDPSADKPIVLSNAERYLESFNGPALFGDDSGSIRKLPGVATRKTMRLDATTTNLSVGADHLNGLGNALNNRIIGNDQDNILDGLSGADTMIGGKGNDSYYVDNAGDRVIEQADQGIDTVYSTVSTRLSANVENLVLLDATKPQTAMINGVHALVYGRPGSYLLDFEQGNAVDGYFGTCSETTIANIAVLAGQSVTEKDVVERAIKEKLCDTLTPMPEYRGGTTPEQQRALLKSFGIDASISDGYDEKQVACSIKEGKGVAVSVSAGHLWGAGWYFQDQANHLVTVTGVAYAEMTGDLLGFYIADSGSIGGTDKCRFLTAEEMRYVTNVSGAHTLTTDAPIRLPNQNLNAGGNELDNILVGNQGANVITGGRGNDVMMGGAGNDTYRISTGDGQDVIYDHDATRDNLDTLSFSNAKQNNLWLRKDGNDLKIEVLGSKDQVTIKDWYVGGDSGTDNHIERIKTADGKTLYDTDVDKLVQAMASFSAPAATQTSWPTTAGSNGKVLLAVSH